MIIALRAHRAAVDGTLYEEQAFVMGGDEEEFLSSEAKTVKQDHDANETRDMILVQGIIDGFFEEEDGFVLYDYKTDHVTSEEQLIHRYRTQLLLYANAIERTHEKPVKEILIYSFALNKVIHLNR